MARKMITKFESQTYELLEGTKLHPIVELFFEFAQLKNLYRQGWLEEGRDVSRLHGESVADHSFGVALLGYFIAEEYRKDLDSLKVMKLGLFHEFGEIRGGDMTPSDDILQEEKTNIERAAVLNSLSALPNYGEYLDIWEDFEYGKSPEAIFVKQVDRLEMALQANLYELVGYKSLDAFFPYVQGKLESPELKEIFNEILKVRK